MSQEAACCVIPSICKVRKWNTYKDKKQTAGYQVWVVDLIPNTVFARMYFCLVVIKNVLKIVPFSKNIKGVNLMA